MIEVCLLALKTFITKFTFVLKIVWEMHGLTMTSPLISSSENFGTDRALVSFLTSFYELIQVFRTS